MPGQGLREEKPFSWYLFPHLHSSLSTLLNVSFEIACFLPFKYQNAGLSQQNDKFYFIIYTSTSKIHVSSEGGKDEMQNM